MLSDEGGLEVWLHIYDLSKGLAAQLSPALIGRRIEMIYHTGIIAYGREWFFGGGIQCGVPGRTHFGRPAERICLGRTQLPFAVFEEYLFELRERFQPEHYHLLRHNCNNFSNEVSQFLVGEEIPSKITGLPDDVLNSPLGAIIAPLLQGIENQMKNDTQGQWEHARPGNQFSSSVEVESVDDEVGVEVYTAGASPTVEDFSDIAEASTSSASSDALPFSFEDDVKKTFERLMADDPSQSPADCAIKAYECVLKERKLGNLATRT